MFKRLLLIAYCLVTFVSYSFATNIIIAQNIFDINDANYNINPGDTIFLDSGFKDYLFLKDINGDALNPIVIINQNGQVEINTTHYYGILFWGCSHIKLSGNGTPGIQYGINISKVEGGSGISIDFLSTDIEIEFVEVAFTKIAGIYAKTDPYFDSECSIVGLRDNFTMYNIVIHDCYLHDIADEGLYIGSSKYTGYNISSNDCGSSWVFPHIIEGVRIYNNIVENTGWDGIQVSSTTKDCYIYGNTIRNDSDSSYRFQMSGILIGGGSNCDCYNNKIFDGKGDGIDIFGFGNHKIYNNLIVRAGKSFIPTDENPNPNKHGIYVGDEVTEADAKMFIYNNTIISPKSFGIKLANTDISSYEIYNNLIVSPGFYESLGSNSYVNILDGINFTQSNNLYSNDIAEMIFLNADNDNYDLEGTSPARNAGKDLTYLGLSFDIDNRDRPLFIFFDIGAYETTESPIGIKEEIELRSKVIISNITPNPVINRSTFHYEVTDPTHIRIFIVNQLGKFIDLIVDEQNFINSYNIEIQNTKYVPGLYYLILECKFGRYSKKFIII